MIAYINTQSTQDVSQQGFADSEEGGSASLIDTLGPDPVIFRFR